MSDRVSLVRVLNLLFSKTYSRDSRTPFSAAEWQIAHSNLLPLVRPHLSLIEERVLILQKVRPRQVLPERAPTAFLAAPQSQTARASRYTC